MGASFRGVAAARACALPALHRRIVAQHGAHGAVHTPGSYSTTRCAIHKTTARRTRRRSHANELQHGIRLQHGAHCAVRILGSDSTAQCVTHRQQHGTHGAVRTPGSYSTAQCATASQQCTVHTQTRALQDTAGRRATREHPKHTRDRDAPHALARAWRTRRRAIGLGCYGYLDPRGHWELEDKTQEHYKNKELED